MTRCKPLKNMLFLVLTNKEGGDGGILYCQICHHSIRCPEKFTQDAFSYWIRGFQEMHKKCRKQCTKQKRRGE
jgi:hypothetical protein